MGCGGLGCLAVIAIFVLGFYVMQHPARLVSFSVSMIERGLEGSLDPAVTPEQREGFRRELRRFRDNLRDQDVPEAQSIMLELNRAIRSDRKFTAEEVESLTVLLRQFNDRRENKPVATAVLLVSPPGGTNLHVQVQARISLRAPG